jgi:hypothetical protein
VSEILNNLARGMGECLSACRKLQQPYYEQVGNVEGAIKHIRIEGDGVNNSDSSNV